MSQHQMIFSIIALCVIGAVFGVAPREGANSRHFFRGHQVPSLVDDPLEDELHSLRDLAVPLSVTETANAPEETSESSNVMTSDIERGLVGPLEIELESDTRGSATPQAAASVPRVSSSSRVPRVSSSSRSKGSAEAPGTASVRTALASQPAKEVSENNNSDPEESETNNSEPVVEEQEQEQEEDEEEENSSDSEDTEEDEGEEEGGQSSVTSQDVTTPTIPEVTRRSLPYGLRSLVNDKRSGTVVQQNKEDEQVTTDPASEERLLDLMVKLAEHPTQWQRVHHELEHLDHELLASRRAVQLLGLARTSSQDRDRLPDALILENEADRVAPSSLPPSTESHQHVHHHGNKQWPQFSYHRVTPVPSANSPAVSASPGHHRSAYVAVSVVTPPAQRNHAKLQHHQHQDTPTPSTPLPDAMDALLLKHPMAHPLSLPEVRPSEEQVNEEEKEVERLVESLRASTLHRGGAWTHERHRDQMKEQLRALEALHAKIEAKWHAQDQVRKVVENIRAATDQ